MEIDLTPRFRSPGPSAYSKGSPLVAFLQNFQQGMDKGNQEKKQNEEKSKRKEAADALLKAHPELQGTVTPDNVYEIAPTVIRSDIEKKQSVPMRNLYRDPKSGLFGDSPIPGADPYQVPSFQAMNILAGQSKQDAIGGRLDEQINARQSADAIRNQNMQKNRILRLVIAQQGKNFKTDKANMDNVIKKLAGFGINLTQDDILQAYQDVTGEKANPSSHQKGKVRISNFTVTP